MAQVTLEINGRPYTIACDDGEEPRVTELGEFINSRVETLSQSIGQVGDSRLLLMASLMLADELSEAIGAVDELKNGHEMVVSQSADAGDAFASILDRATKRVEDIAARLEDA